MRLALFLMARTIIRGDKWSLVLTTLIMLVVFLNLLFVDAVFAGITATMDSIKIDYQYGEVIVEPTKNDPYIKRAPLLVDRIRDLAPVRAVTSHLVTHATLLHDKHNDGRDVVRFAAPVMGVRPERERAAIDIASHMIEGRYLRPGERGKAILGADLAGGYGVSVYAKDLEGVRTGDTIDVIYDNGVRRSYDIVGIYRTKNFETDAKMIVTQKDLRSVLGTRNEASEVIVRLHNRDDAPAVARAIAAMGIGDYDIADWHDKLSFGRSINKSFEIIGAMLRVIGSIVAGLVIFIVIFVDIVNRRKQIGILKAIGVPDRMIIASFAMRGMLYTFAGLVLGYCAMRYGVIAYFRVHPIDFPMGWMVPLVKKHALMMSILLFLLAGAIGSLLPAVKEVHKKILHLMR